MRLKTLWATMAAVLCVATLGAQDPARERKLQQAIDLLETKGDVARATPLLEDVAKSSDRGLAARALLYLGQAQERQGKEQARRTYERIIRDFGSQQQVVAQARARLAGLRVTDVPAGVAQRSIWTLPPGTLPYGPVSGNGRHLLYRDSKLDLYLHDFSGASSDRLLVAHKGDTYVQWATLSRDAKQVAYVLPEGDGSSYSLHVTSLTNRAATAHRRVSADPTVTWLEPYDWSPDGQWVAAVMYLKGSDEIAVVSVSDGSRRTLEKAPLLGPTKLAFSPDGEYLAYDFIRAGARDVAIVPLAGGPAVLVGSHRAEERLVGWAPDGRALLFTSDRSGTNSLWKQRFDGVAQGPPELLQSELGGLYPLGVAQDGRVYWATANQPRVSDVKVGTFNFGSGEWIAQPREAVQEYFTGAASSPDLSPDGRLLVYISTRRTGAGADSSLTIRELESGDHRELKLQLDYITSVRWAPAGDGLVIRGHKDAHSGIWRVDAATGEVALLEKADSTATGSLAIVGWSADSKRFYFRRQAPTPSLTALDWPSGANRTELLRTPDNAGYPLPSPDGTKIYYSRTLSGTAPYIQRALVERDIATGTEKELIRRNLGGVNLSPDGRFIATGSNDPGTSRRTILLVSTSGAPTRELMRGQAPATPEEGLSVHAWAPDSASVVVRKGLTGGNAAELWWVPIQNPDKARLMLKDATPSVDNGGGMRIHANGQVAFVTRQAPSSIPRQVWVLENILPVRK